MKFGDNFITGRNQLQGVMLLLAAAVVLPTVCLLWFMNQAVKNERLVVRQKMMDVYEGQMELLNHQMDDRWADRTRYLDTIARSNLKPARTFATVIETSGSNQGRLVCSGIVIYDANGGLLYPIVDEDSDYYGQSPEEITGAWNAEFVENEPLKAAQVYAQVAEMHPGSYTGRLALMGKVRCLNKAGEIENAIRECQKLAYEENKAAVEPASAALTAQARLQLVAMRKKTSAGLTRADVVGLIDSATNYTGDQTKDYLPLASNTRLFFLSKALEILRESPWAVELEVKAAFAEKLLAAEQNAAAAVDMMRGSARSGAITKDDAQNLITALQTIIGAIENSDWSERFKVDANQARELLAAAQRSNSALDNDRGAVPTESKPRHRLHKLGAGSDLLGLYHNTPGRIFLFLCTPEQVRADFAVIEDKLTKLGLSYRITDSAGAYVAGLEKTEEKPFITSAMGNYLSGWQISLYADQTSTFQKAASRRIALYTWTAILVIVMILLAGGFAAQAVRKQIRLNKMKNDFLATVSHELKTPLASIRLLVDTLLEGNYKDQHQAVEYFQLVSKENERLTRLVDNFLTFSRMERNKQTFAMAEANPADIARAAAEVVKTKFNTGRCDLQVQIDNNLPDILADRDIMVTAIVNLLDNAYKYSYDDKKIELKVFSENSLVCFSVKDNGIGMTRRQMKKIFDRFYQADTSLSRRVEGTGLGLSIVKFIVDAHKGTISVDSRPGEGSTFAVRIPVWSKQTD
ncbi:MAG: HAMP domain-containing sensor histidine kinase [Sedimentisphaerales bacterium]